VLGRDLPTTGETIQTSSIKLVNIGVGQCLGPVKSVCVFFKTCIVTSHIKKRCHLALKVPHEDRTPSLPHGSGWQGSEHKVNT
jgi:hypothetical protein